MRPGRIVVLNDIAVPKGGATALALASARAFRERGEAVTYLCGDEGRNPELAALGVDLVGLGSARLTSLSPGRAMVSGLYNREARALVERWIAAHDTPDTVYHLHGWAQILSPSVFAALRPVLPRTLLSAHDFFLACPNGAYAFLKSGAVCPLTPLSPACIRADCDRRSYPHKLWRVARQAVYRNLFDVRRSPPVLAIHEAMRPFLMRGAIPDAAIQTLPNPVRPWSDTRIRAEDNRGFLFIGRLEDTKGPDLACAAARAAGQTLTLVGDGVLRERLAAEYPEMRFLGQQPPAALPDIVRGHRALLMPSRYPEPYGLVATEALWSGLPVIAADTAFLAADIVDAEAGLAAPPRDTPRLAGAMRRIADDDLLCATMSRNAFERTRHLGLGFDAWIDRLLASYAARLEAAALAA
ncbi:glycosyltransferase family 4 protein [Coralloluteibacterium stylophorae]|uniref:Glycosyltransferase family 4 protein n=1 Tax=Coralloluteibacterium stylophorae TaxID=1776034 RepID=A0A8J8AYV5_9GAMM|nr:glycosyltransferase family 4 protein [Coralloluteibacterium stylophorae]